MNKIIKNIGSLVLIVLVSFLVARFTIVSNDSNQNDVYQKVISSGVIKACYVVYPPASIKDPNTGELSGIFVESLNKAASNMGLTVDWNAEVGWGEMIESLNSGKCDVVGSPAWTNPTRAKNAEFSIPLYYSAINAYGRIDENRFSNGIAGLNNSNFVIVTVDGETSQVIAKNQFPNAKTLELTQKTDVGQMLLNVSSNKADVAFMEPAVANTYISKNPGKIKNLTSETPVITYGNIMLIKKGEFRLKSMLDNSLGSLINSGYVEELISKYEAEYPGGFYRVAPDYLVPRK